MLRLISAAALTGVPHPLRALALACVAGMASIHLAAASPAPLASARAPLPAPPAPDPRSLLLGPGDLPRGYVSDDALENADATARTAAYSASVVSSSFAAYRRRTGAVVHYVALLRGQAGAALVLRREGAAVARTREAAALTLAGRRGGAPWLAYQQRGTRGAAWVMAARAAGPYVTVVGAYAGEGEQTAIDLVQRLTAVVDARLLAAAARVPAQPPARGAAIRLALRVTALVTTTRDQRAAGVFRPHSTLYWRTMWRIEHPPRGARETVRETVWQGKRVLYSNNLADRPYDGDNEADDHLLLPGLAPGRYNVTVVVWIGRLSAYATRAFRVVAPPAKKG